MLVKYGVTSRYNNDFTEMVFDLTPQQYPAIQEVLPEGSSFKKLDILPSWLKTFMLSQRDYHNDSRRDYRSGGRSYTSGGFMQRRSDDRYSDRGGNRG